MFEPILRLTSAFSIVLMSTPFMHAQSPPTPDQTAKTFRRTITVQEKLDYLLFLPSDYDSARAEGWPMILFLHGVGERGSDLSRVKSHGPPKRVERDPAFPFIVVSPQCPDGQIWVNSPLLGLLDEVITAYNVDTNRIYLTGLSMGGYGTWNLGLAHAERFAAIAPICGGGQPIAVHLADRPHQSRLSRLPVWAFHGAKDPVVPLAESQRMVSALESIGNKHVKLTVYPEATHDAWTETYANPEFYKWLLQHKRQP